MSLTRLLLAALLFAGLVGGVAALPAAAQKSPERIRLTPQSRDGAVLLRVDEFPAQQHLWFQRAGSSGFGSRVYMIEVDAGTGRGIYVARTLKPGRYRLDSIWQQNRWGLLLKRDTVEFEIRPGAITYLGRLDNGGLLQTLQREAVAAGKTVASGPPGSGGFTTDEHGTRPVFAGRDEAGLAEAAAFAAQVMQAPPGMVELGQLYESRAAN